MHSVSIAALKRRLRECVRLAQAGEVVLVTKGSRVVAELGPPAPRAPMGADPVLVDLVRRGVLTPPLLVRQGPPPRVPVSPAHWLLGELAHNRRDR